MAFPDFGKSHILDQVSSPLFSVWNKEKEWVSVPSALTLATNPFDQKQLGFYLELVRGPAPFLPPAPYGVLEMQLEPENDLARIIEALREIEVGAVVHHPTFQQSVLSVDVALTDDALQQLIVKPEKSGVNALGSMLSVRHLSQETAMAFKAALEGEQMNLAVVAEMEILGMAPRLPVQVTLDPGRVLAKLLSLADSDRVIHRKVVHAAFYDSIDSAALFILESGEINNKELLAATLTDHVRKLLGEFAPCPSEVKEPCMRLVSTTALPARVIDLSRPLRVPRVFILNFHPLEAMRQIVETHGVDAVVHKTVVPSMNLGHQRISISANLPLHINGSQKIGVDLHAPANAPHRQHQLDARITFKDFNDDSPTRKSHNEIWKLALNESLSYEATPFVILPEAGGKGELFGETFTSSAPSLTLDVNHFPVRFISLEATASLLKQADIKGKLVWEEGDSQPEISFRLTPAQSALTLVIPKAAQGLLHAQLAQRDGTEEINLPSLQAQSYRWTPYAVPEFGSQKVEINCQFDDDASFQAIELSPESDPEEISLMTFSPGTDTKSYSWFAESIFRPGFRYRWYNTKIETPWSEVQSPFVPLKIQSSAAVKVEKDTA